MTDFFDGARPDTFRCQAFVNMILDIIYRSGSPKVLTDGLEVICNAPEKPSESAPFVDSNTLSAYKEKLYEEVRSNKDKLEDMDVSLIKEGVRLVAIIFRTCLQPNRWTYITSLGTK